MSPICSTACAAGRKSYRDTDNDDRAVLCSFLQRNLVYLSEGYVLDTRQCDLVREDLSLSLSLCLSLSLYVCVCVCVCVFQTLFRALSRSLSCALSLALTISRDPSP
jgi:hypothetical protein